jgi:hypothetical protein
MLHAVIASEAKQSTSRLIDVKLIVRGPQLLKTDVWQTDWWIASLRSQ